MLIKEVHVRPDEAATDTFTAEAILLYDDGEEESLWFSGLPREAARAARQSANPWLVSVLPIAVTIGEDVATALPADRMLLANLAGLQKIWKDWFPHLKTVRIDCPSTSDFARAPVKTVRRASFFSGGVDSFHIVAEHCGPHRIGALDALITIGGFDIPHENVEEFAKVQASAAAVARAMDAMLYSVTTNLRRTRFRKAHWGRHSHGCALAAVALLFQEELTEVLIGATRTFPNVRRWGSHPLTDPLCSTSAMRITHFGTTASRVEKTESLCGLPIALEHLRVCWKRGRADNCGECIKCLRTAATLHVLGELGNCPTFDAAGFSLQRLEGVTIDTAGEFTYFGEIRDLAERRGDACTQIAVEKVMARSARLLRASTAKNRFIERLARWAKGKPLVWRFAAKAEAEAQGRRSRR